MNSKCWDTYIWNWKIVAFLDPSYIKFLDKSSVGEEEEYEREIRVNIPNDNVSVVNLRTANLSEEEIEIVKEMSLENNEKEEEKTEPINQNELIDTVENEKSFRESIGVDFKLKYAEYSLQSIYDTEDPIVCKKRHGRTFNFKFDPKMFPIALPPPKQILGVGSLINVGNDTVYRFENEKTERGRKYPVMIVTKYKFSHTHPHIRLLNAQYRFCQINNCMSDIKNLFRGLTFNYETSNAFLIKNTHSKKGKRFHTELLGLLFNLNNIEILLNSSMPSRLVNKFLTKMYLLVKEKYPQLTILPPAKEEDTNRFNVNTNDTITHAPDGIKHPRIDITNQLKYINKNNKVSTISVIIFVQILLQSKTRHKFDINNYLILGCIQSCLSKEMYLLHPDIQKKVNEFTQKKAVSHYEVRVEIEKIIIKKKRLDTRRIMNQLKSEDNHNILKTILKTRYQKYYKNIYFKLINQPNLYNPIVFINTLIYLNITGVKESKHINHLTSFILNNNKMSSKMRKQTMESLIGVLDHIQHTINDVTKHDYYDATGKYVVRAYIKVIRKIISNEKLYVDKAIPKSQRCYKYNKIPTWQRWNDMYKMANELGIRIRPNKFETAEQVDYLHDKFSEYFQRDQEILNNLEGFFFSKFDSPSHSYKVNDKEFWFVQLETPNELVQEGKEMHHCVGSYGKQCAKGESIIFSMTDGNRSYVTVEIKEYLSKYELGQVYTLNDNIIKNDKIMDTINKWYQECMDIHKQDKVSYQELSSNRYQQYKMNKKIDSLNEILIKHMEDDSLITKEHYEKRLENLNLDIARLQETIDAQTQLYNIGKEVENQ